MLPSEVSPKTPQEVEAYRQVEKLRERLLDLTKRNKLLNFKHATRGRDHIRIVDEPLSNIFKKINAGNSLIFKPLPDPQKGEPSDENTDIFQSYLREELASDSYKNKLDEIYLTFEEDNDEEGLESALNELDRKIRNKVREDLGLSSLQKEISQSNASWARQHNIDPSFNLFSITTTKTWHHDKQLQTLLLPKELERKLKSIYQLQNESLKEKGINTLFCVFGFVEWSESEDSTKTLCAPLILFPIRIDRESKKSVVEFSIEATGDEPTLNRTLYIRLKKEGVELPPFHSDSSIEDYINTAEKAVKQKNGWSIRPYLTIGHFAFHRLAMYEDLSMDRWPANEKPFQNPLVKELLGGRESTNTCRSSEIYNPDTLETNSLPPLIRDADSSQFSAIIDVLKGKNLVIQGPPGTGKSQTITNIIGASLAANKTILFVSEKLSALEVVKKRLDEDGIGDFCFELHSTKSSKSNILENIKRRLKLNVKPDKTHKDELSLTKSKQMLSEYLTLLQEEICETKITIEEALWLARRTSHTDMPQPLRECKLTEAHSLTSSEIKNIKHILSSLAKSEKELSDAPHLCPWNFIKRPYLNTVDHYNIRDILNNIETKCIHINNEQADYSQALNWNFPHTLPSINSFLESIDSIPVILDDDEKIGYNMLGAGCNYKIFTTLIQLHAKISEIEKALNSSTPFKSRTPEEIQKTIEESLRLAKEEKINFKYLQEIEKIKQTHEEHIRLTYQCQSALETFSRETKIDITDANLANLESLRNIINAVDSMPSETLNLRIPILASEESQELLQNIKTNWSKIVNKKSKFSEETGIDLTAVTPRQIKLYLNSIKNSGIFSIFKASYRASIKATRLLYKENRNRDKIELLSDLEEINNILSKEEAYITSDKVSIFTPNPEIDIDTSISIAEAVARWFSLLRKCVASYPWGQQLISFFATGPIETVESIIALLKTNKEHIHELIDHLQEHQISDSIAYINLNEAKAKSCEYLKSNLIDSLQLPLHFSAQEVQGVAQLAKEYIQTDLKITENTAKLSLIPLTTNTSDPLHLISLAYPKYEAVAKNEKINETLKSILLSPNGGDTLERLHSIKDQLKILTHDLKQIIEKLNYYSNDENPKWLNGTWEEILKNLDFLKHRDGDLGIWCEWYNALDQLSCSIGSKIKELIMTEIHASTILEHFDTMIGIQLSETAIKQHSIISKYAGFKLEDARNLFRKLDKNLKSSAKEEIITHLKTRELKAPWGKGTGSKLEWTEKNLLENLASLTRLHHSMTARKILKQAGIALQHLMPCFMMSPLSLSQYIMPDGIKFDIVIFDEASQVLPEDALGALLRGKQFVIVGDQMQLPPTSFFNSNQNDELDEDTDIQIEESILEKAQTVFQPSRRLLWHYRSKHPSLIAYSNQEFYDNELQIFPSPHQVHPEMGVKYIQVDGKYIGRSNPIEADKLVSEVISFMKRSPTKSIGVVAINSVQRELIEQKLELAISQSDEAIKYIKSWEHTLEPIFVKNLESVQGDERDAIFISTVYGKAPDSNNRPAQRFGPILLQAGHRRLNVLFTRAKEVIYLFSSLNPEDILVDETSNWGKKVFKNYLEYARSGRLHIGTNTGKEPDSEFEVQVRDRLRASGYDCDFQIGVAGYFVDLGVKHPQFRDHYLLGIECDGAKYHSFQSARDRDRLRQDVLESLEWKIHRIWSTDWFSDPEREVQKIISKLRKLQATTRIHLPQQKQKLDLPIEPIKTKSIRKIRVGDTVKYIEVSSDQEYEVTIVSSNSIPELGLINANTPIAKALIGNAEGQKIEVPLPKGKTYLKIIEIKHSHNHSFHT